MFAVSELSMTGGGESGAGLGGWGEVNQAVSGFRRRNIILS